MSVIGPLELLLLLIVGFFALGLPIGIVILLVVLLRREKHTKGDSMLTDQLREKNPQLGVSARHSHS